MNHSVPSDAPVTVVAVHGNGGGSFRFSRLPASPDPAVRLRAIDLPGFGGRPAQRLPVTLDELSDALRDELRTAGPGPVVVLGHGIGGSIALHALQETVDGVVGLVLHAPVAARLDTRWFPRLMRPRWVRRGVQLAISSLPARLVGRLLLFRDGDVPRSFADRFLAEYRRADGFADMFDLLTADWFAGLRPIDVPTVLLWGERDRVLGADQVTELLAVVPGARQQTVAEWGHFPMIERPGEYLAVVTRLASELAAE